MKTRQKLSVLMISKNAEKTIEQSLNSIRNLASEIVLVDGGSTDKTINIAKKFSAKIFYYLGQDWGRQCQIGLERTTGDWILVLDSDEIVTKELAKEIVSLLNCSIVKEVGYKIPFQNHYFGRPLKYGGEDYKKMVLFKNNSAFVEKTLVHYFYQLKKGKAGLLKNKILHYSYFSFFKIYKKFTDYGIRMAKKKYLVGEKSSFKKIFFYPVHMFWARFIKDKGYKDGLFRIPLDIGFAYMEFLTYFFLLFLSLRGVKRRSNLFSRLLRFARNDKVI